MHADLREAFERACAAKDLEKAWESFQALASAYHQSRAALAAPVVRTPAGIKLREPEPIQPREEHPLVDVSRREVKRLRRIEALLAEWGPDPAMGARAQTIREALMRAEGSGSEWTGAMEAAELRWHWEHLLDAAKLRARNAARAARQQRRDDWHTFCSESMAAGGGKVFRWVREGTRSLRAPAGHDWQAGQPGPPQARMLRSRPYMPSGPASGPRTRPRAPTWSPG